MGEEDLIVGQSNRGRTWWNRRGWFLIASILLLAACSSDSATPTTPLTTSAPGVTQPTVLPLSATGTECRNALVAIDAYIVAKQAAGSDETNAAAARARCLASPEVPASCLDAMRISVTIGKLSADNVEFVSAYTSYGEASTLCRLKLLKSI